MEAELSELDEQIYAQYRSSRPDRLALARLWMRFDSLVEERLPDEA